MKKKHLATGYILLTLIVLLAGFALFTNLFKPNLKIKLIVENLKGIHENTMINEIRAETLIPVGKVSKIKINDIGQSVVHLTIFSDYTDSVKEGSLFIVSRPFLSVDAAYILIDTIPEHVGNPPLKPGSIVYETFHTKYNLMLAGKAIKNGFDQFKAQSEQFLKELDAYLQSDEFEHFMEQVRQLGDEIAAYTMEQKERFEKEILPRIQEKINEAMKELQEKDEDKEANELEKEMIEIRKQLKG